jgi:phosphonate metabolism protein (transferase hexapeptide repeat family)
MALSFPKNNLEPTEAASAPQIHPSASVTNSVIGSYTDIGANWTVTESRLGDYSYLAGSDGTVSYTDIGKFCSIASHVVINPGDHPMDRVTQHHCTYRRRRYGFEATDDEEVFEWRRRRKCRIGHDVWIGNGAKIMAGINIGTGAVVAAGAVVTRDVLPYQVVAGVPARPLRMRFAPAVIDKLMAIAWWDWDRRTLEHRFGDFSNLERFLATYG